MVDRKEFHMSDEQYAVILDASQPVPVILIGGLAPRSTQERANMAWRILGDELGFLGFTVRPILGKDAHYFTAEPIEQEST